MPDSLLSHLWSTLLVYTFYHCNQILLIYFKNVLFTLNIKKQYKLNISISIYYIRQTPLSFQYVAACY